MADNGSIRRCDIVVIGLDKIKRQGIVLDRTVGFEISNTQPEDIHKEKKFTIQQLHKQERSIKF